MIYENTTPQQPYAPIPQQPYAPVQQIIDAPKPLPSTTKLDLNSIKGYSQKRKALKLLKMKEDCKTELIQALNIFDPHEINLNHTAVLFCAQIVVDFFCKPKQGLLKEEIVIDVCKQYFNGDPELVKMVLELVFDKIIKTTLFRRNKERIKNALSWLAEVFGIIHVQTTFSTNLKL